MGNAESNLSPPPMRIHQLHGKFLRVSQDRLSATRFEGYADAMFFGSRPAERDEKIELVITEMTANWNGSLRFGFTSHNPIAICNHPEGIPRFMCPDLVKRGGSFIESLNHIRLLPGDRIVFWVTQNGDVRLNINDVVQRSQVTKLVTTPVWPVVDLYGNAVGLKFRSLNDDPNELDEVKEARYYAALNFIELQIQGNPGSIEIVNKCLKRNNNNKAFAWNSRPLNVNHIWVLFVNELDEGNASNMSFAIGLSPPGPAHSLPDTLQRLNNRPVIFENVYCRNVVGDEMAVCIINDGDVMVALNGKDFQNIGKVPKSDFYWLVADMNCGVRSLTSLGTFPLTEDLLPALPNLKSSNLLRERNILVEKVPVIESKSSIIETSPTMNSPQPEIIVEENKCLKCKNAKPNSVFISCGDICCCSACADSLFRSTKTCPRCNLTFTKTIKVFF